MTDLIHTTETTLRGAVYLPPEIGDALPDIVEDALQAGFAKIAERLEGLGFPVTGDFAPDEVFTIERAFDIFVRSMSLNNPDVARLNDEDERFVVEHTEDGNVRVRAATQDEIDDPAEETLCLGEALEFGANIAARDGRELLTPYDDADTEV